MLCFVFGGLTQAIAAMKDIGYDLSVHASKSLDEVKDSSPFDAVVTMGCGQWFIL